MEAMNALWREMTKGLSVREAETLRRLVMAQARFLRDLCEAALDGDRSSDDGSLN